MTSDEQAWLDEAADCGWDTDAILSAIQEVRGGEMGGLWRCANCCAICLDPALASHAQFTDESAAVIIDSTTVLCAYCHADAIEARRMIRVERGPDGGIREDRSSLRDYERDLAAYLDAADAAASAAEREQIAFLPPDERRWAERRLAERDQRRFLLGKKVFRRSE